MPKGANMDPMMQVGQKETTVYQLSPTKKKTAEVNFVVPVKSGKKVRLPVLPVLFFCILIATAVAAIYFYIQLDELKRNPQKNTQDQVKAIIDKVSQLVLLPDGEVPTVATVADPELLKDQPFFAKAQKGDRLLIYTNAKKAILYNPRSNKIVEIAPLSIGSNQAVENPSQDSQAAQENKNIK